jgi:hypothetical protein
MKPKQNLKRNQARKNYGLLPDRKIEKQSKKTQERRDEIWVSFFGDYGDCAKVRDNIY